MMVSGVGRKRCPYYPVYLDVCDRPALVVGGGDVAARKVAGLLEAGAQVRVVAERPSRDIESWADTGAIELERRAWRPDDVQDAFLVYCATDDAQVNEAAFVEAVKRGALANVVDDPAHCSFIVPSVVRRGALQMAVSTGGCAPTLAKRIRRELEERYPKDLEGYVDFLGEMRALVKERVSGGEADRAPYFEASCDPALLERYRAGEALDAESMFAEIAETIATCAKPTRSAQVGAGDSR